MLRGFVLIFIALLYSLPISAQKLKGQARVDSLVAALDKVHVDSSRAKLLNSITANYLFLNYDKCIEYGKQGIALASEIKFKPALKTLYANIADAYRMKGSFDTAFLYAQKLEKIVDELGDIKSRALFLRIVIPIYKQQGNLVKAAQGGLDMLKIYEELRDSIGIAVALQSVAGDYQYQNNYDSAEQYYKRAIIMWKAVGLKMNEAYGNYNLGNMYMWQKDFDKSIERLKVAEAYFVEKQEMNGLGLVYANYAEINLNRKRYRNAIESAETYLGISQKRGDNYGIASSYGLLGLAHIGLAKEQPAQKALHVGKAIHYLKDAVAQNLKQGNLREMVEQMEDLANAYKMAGDYKKAFEVQEQFVQYKDSVYNKANTEKITRLQVSAQFEKKQAIDSTQNAEAHKLANVKLQRQRTLTYSGIGAALLLLAFSAFVYRNNKRLAIEKQKSENLLHNILPQEIASELKERGATSAQQYDHVTVLFTDFVNFTKAGERMGSRALVEELHNCFEAFDGIMGTYGIEKIKTIGDAYLAVCGLPTTDEHHAEKVVKAAQEIRDFMVHRYAALGDKTFEIRIGVHSGEVVAGIVGVKKFAYDIWGDTVNTAARMEAKSEAGKINISQTTYELVKDKYTCSYRGEIDAKNKGMMKMYFVEN